MSKNPNNDVYPVPGLSPGEWQPAPLMALTEPGQAFLQEPGSDPVPQHFEAQRTSQSAPSHLAKSEWTDRAQQVLKQGIHGLCFSPYLEGQSPGDAITPEQIQQRLAVVQPHTRWVRTFSCTEGHELVPGIAKQMGLKTLVGAWLGTDAKTNAREVAGLIEVARAGHADLVAVGNEVLLREDLSPQALVAFLEQVKHALPEIPVGYVDAYYLFEEHPEVTAACDVILTNCYPYWEGCPLDQAIAYMQSMYRRTQAVAGGKPVVISETGWPHKGTAFHGAVPSQQGAMQYFAQTAAWAQAEQIDVFYFSAFDETWKVGAEGDVGAYWGLWDKDGLPKF